jgi:hypothetical protein
MASTLLLDFSLTRRPPWNPSAEFVNNTPQLSDALVSNLNLRRGCRPANLLD